MRIAVVLHSYYTPEHNQIVRLLNLAGHEKELYVTCHVNFPYLDKLDRAHIYSNLGRDIRPFLEMLRAGILDEYDVVLKLHTKRSPHLAHGRLIAVLLQCSLIRTKSQIQKLFEDPRVGLAGPRSFFFEQDRHWGQNRARVEQLCDRMNVKSQLAFFGGSMFWCRPKALRRLRVELDAFGSFEAEAGQIDGCLHHAIERCFSISAAADGYSTIDMGGAALLPGIVRRPRFSPSESGPLPSPIGFSESEAEHAA